MDDPTDPTDSLADDGMPTMEGLATWAPESEEEAEAALRRMGRIAADVAAASRHAATERERIDEWLADRTATAIDYLLVLEGRLEAWALARRGPLGDGPKSSKLIYGEVTTRGPTHDPRTPPHQLHIGDIDALVLWLGDHDADDMVTWVPKVSVAELRRRFTVHATFDPDFGWDVIGVRDVKSGELIFVEQMDDPSTVPDLPSWPLRVEVPATTATVKPYPPTDHRR